MFLAPYSYAYIGIALVLVRYFAGWIWRDERKNRESRNDDRYSYLYHEEVSPFGCFMIGALGAAFWPLVAVVLGATSAYDHWPERIMWLFFHEPSRERRERQLKRRREEIARMEKELGIDA